MEILQYVTDALGDASYLVVDSGEAAVVDPQRDVRPYLEDAAKRGLTISYVFETHVHNDYVSGAGELRALGATVVGPKSGGYTFDFHGVEDGDEVRVGSAVIRAIASPGHTFEHTSFLGINGDGEIVAAFTGGSVLVAAAGRSDLLGPDHAEELTRMQWESARRLARDVPASAEVFPTHGTGSFCSANSTVTERRSLLSVEIARNPVFSPQYETFRDGQLGVSMPIPVYYRQMAPINRAGPRPYGVPPAPALVSAEELAGLRGQGGWLVDTRERLDHAAGHLPGALGIQEGNVFLAYTGWLTPFNARMGLVAYNQQQAERVSSDLFRIGYEQVESYVPADHHTGGQVIERTSADGIARLLASRERPVLDVRFGYEHSATPLPGALERPIDRIAEWVDEIGPLNPAVVCASGMRAVMAASYLQMKGFDAAAFADGGAEDVASLLPH